MVNLEQPARSTLHPEFVRAITDAAREWLTAQPDAQTLSAHVPALELVFAANVKNHVAANWALLQTAIARVNDTLDLETVGWLDVAALLDLNLRLWQCINADAYLQAARRLTAHAVKRFDAEREMFHANAPEDGRLFCVDLNAGMADALYRAWRALDDPAARSIAGTLLGNVSDAYVAGEGLFQRVEMPDGARTETQHIAAYANAIQMFLTASETTGRGTYISRASILADLVLAQIWADASRMSFDQRAILANAFTRLYSFAGFESYEIKSRDLLSKTIDVPVSVNAASFALAVERYSAVV